MATPQLFCRKFEFVLDNCRRKCYYLPVTRRYGNDTRQSNHKTIMDEDFIFDDYTTDADGFTWNNDMDEATQEMWKEFCSPNWD